MLFRARRDFAILKIPNKDFWTQFDPNQSSQLFLHPPGFIPNAWPVLMFLTQQHRRLRFLFTTELLIFILLERKIGSEDVNENIF